jgi:hypothetical protein
LLQHQYGSCDHYTSRNWIPEYLKFYQRWSFYTSSQIIKNRSFPFRNKYTSVCYWIISLSSFIVEEIYRNEKLFNHG